MTCNIVSDVFPLFVSGGFTQPCSCLFYNWDCKQIQAAVTRRLAAALWYGFGNLRIRFALVSALEMVSSKLL